MSGAVPQMEFLT